VRLRNEKNNTVKFKVYGLEAGMILRRIVVASKEVEVQQLARQVGQEIFVTP
jgi:hypothetical protein